MDAFFLLKQVLAGQIHQVINDCFSGERYFLDDEDGFFSPVFFAKTVAEKAREVSVVVIKRGFFVHCHSAVKTIS
jgi:hypothetical protein